MAVRPALSGSFVPAQNRKNNLEHRKLPSGSVEARGVLSFPVF
jgi:hypothetical protein